MTLLLVLCACGKAQPTWQEQYDLGVRYLSEGNYEEAIIAFNAAIEIDPKRAEAYEKLADAYVALGDSESALEVLRQGAEAIGDDALFQSRIDELTAQESASGLRVERRDVSDGRYDLLYYDEAGNLTRTEFYNPDGMYGYHLHYYDEAGNETRREQYSPDGAMEYYWLYYYDEAGNRTQTERYDPDGTLRYSTTYD